MSTPFCLTSLADMKLTAQKLGLYVHRPVQLAIPEVFSSLVAVVVGFPILTHKFAFWQDQKTDSPVEAVTLCSLSEVCAATSSAGIARRALHFGGCSKFLTNCGLPDLDGHQTVARDFRGLFLKIAGALLHGSCSDKDAALRIWSPFRCVDVLDQELLEISHFLHCLASSATLA